LTSEILGGRARKASTMDCTSAAEAVSLNPNKTTWRRTESGIGDSSKVRVAVMESVVDSLFSGAQAKRRKKGRENRRIFFMVSLLNKQIGLPSTYFKMFA
jgi:hypothetical protein